MLKLNWLLVNKRHHGETPSVRGKKRECQKKRSAKMAYQSSKFTLKYIRKMHIHSLHLESARQSLFSEIINMHSKNSHMLFASLINPLVQIPPTLDSTIKCNEFASVFMNKFRVSDRLQSLTKTYRYRSLPVVTWLSWHNLIPLITKYLKKLSLILSFPHAALMFNLLAWKGFSPIT